MDLQRLMREDIFLIKSGVERVVKGKVKITFNGLVDSSPSPAIARLSMEEVTVKQSSLSSNTEQCLAGDRARPGSHWSSSNITVLSLVQSFIVLLHQLSYAIKNQRKARNTPSRVLWAKYHCETLDQ